MIHSYSQHRSYFFLGRLLTGLLLATWLAPAAHGEGWPWPFNSEEKPGKPDKIIAFWSDTVLTQTGRPPIRGFGGRLMFYEGKKEEPIKVEGTLVVYAFDETDRDANNTRPDRKYAFTPQQLPLHYSKSKIGHSYSVWLPWDEVGGPQKESRSSSAFSRKKARSPSATLAGNCFPAESIAARAAMPADGMFCPRRAEHAATVLPPLPATGANGMAGPPMTTGGVQPASYQAPETDSAGVLPAAWQQRHITTATIDVPSGSAIRSAITSPQVSPAAGIIQPARERCGRRPGPGRTTRRGTIRRRQHAPPSAPTSVSPGLQLRSGFEPGQQWPLGEPLARLSRDRAPSPPPPAGSPSGPASPPGQGPANAGPAVPPGVAQSPN